MLHQVKFLVKIIIKTYRGRLQPSALSWFGAVVLESERKVEKL